MPDEPEISRGDEDDWEARMRDIEDKASSIKAKAAASTPQPADYESRLVDIESKARAAKGRHLSTMAEEERRVNEGGEANRGLGLGLGIGYTIVGVPLVGAVIGWLLDNQLHTGYWKGMCTLAGAVVGVVMAIVMLNRNESGK